jgi:hypothetical protein
MMPGPGVIVAERGVEYHFGLPAEVSSLVERGLQIAAVLDGLHASRVVTLTGPGGCGKTRLALKLANSEVQHPYLVHLSRMASSRQGATEDIIAGIRERPKIAYFHHDLKVKEVSYRYLGSPDITKEKHPAR